MPMWQIALLVFIPAWSMQALGTYLQTRHYAAVMGEASRDWSNGFVGTGNARSRFGAGVILMVVVSPDHIVRRLMIMKGRSVFARFARLPEVEGQAVATLDRSSSFQDKANRAALSVALGQIEKAASRRSARETSLT